MDKKFFVTVIRNPGTPSQRVGFLLGPYDDHETALANVERGRTLANEADPWTAFDAFGTTGAPERASVFGK